MVALWTVPPQGAAKTEHSPAETGKETGQGKGDGQGFALGASAQQRG